MPILKLSEMNVNAPGVRTYGWGPDTCGCWVEEFHNPETDEWSGRVPAGKPKFKKCDAHAKVPNDEIYEVLRTETANKNLAHGKAVEHAGSYSLTADDKRIMALIHRMNNPSHTGPVEIPDALPHPDKGFSYEFQEVPGSHVRKLKAKLHGYTEDEKITAKTKIHEVVNPDHIDIE